MESTGDADGVTAGVRPRASRSAKRIVVAVGLAVVVLVGLAWWVLVAPYEVDPPGAGRPIDCDDVESVTAADVWQDVYAAEEQVGAGLACDDARSSRRTTALLLGAAVATAAAAASTIPSRRLTGEALGPPD